MNLKDKISTEVQNVKYANHHCGLSAERILRLFADSGYVPIDFVKQCFGIKHEDILELHESWVAEEPMLSRPLNMDAKQFIIAHSAKASEASENGYDLRFEEHEWLTWMELYATYKSSPSQQRIIEICPKCFGEGFISSIGTSSSATMLCPVCEGSRYFKY